VLDAPAVVDRFILEREISSGGMGTIFRARDREGDGIVALKVIRGKHPADIERFTQEAAVLASLRHPGIVRYIAHGTTSDGERYLAMEWLEGEDLSARLARKALSIGESVALMRRAAHALAFVHARGVVHRDIKPSNLFVVDRDVEQLKVVDFGIALPSPEAPRLTRTGVLVGTPGYMAPEQIQARPSYDPRADVFSLGCVFFECLADRPAFDGQHPMAVLAKIILDDLPRLRDLQPDVPEVLDALIARMMAKAPEERPADCAEVAAELDRIGDLPASRSAETRARPARSEPPESEAPASSLGSMTLTLDEQRIVSIVLAGHPHAFNAPSAGAGPPLPELARALKPYGARLHALADGFLVVTLWGDGTAVDRAEGAARCALVLRARFDTIPIFVATGRGRVSMRVIEGAVLDRGMAALARAQGGVVTVDNATAHMLRNRFELEDARGAHVLCGERASPEGAPLLLGKPTRCVGRSRELSALEGVLSGCIEEGVATAVVVTGVAGAGKSRLCRELLSRVEQRGEPVEVLIGRGSSLGTSSPFGMIADAIHRAAGIGGEPLEVRRQKLVEWLCRVAGDAPRDLAAAQAPEQDEPSEPKAAHWVSRIAPFLGEIAQIPFRDDESDALQAARTSPPLMSDATRAAWEEWLAAACRVKPVLIVLEDLHWGDAATVQLLDATLRRLRELPLMILALGRPEVHAKFPALWSEREVQTIRLLPLPRRASEQLVREALGPAVADEVVARVVERADGNPFHIEELIRAIVAGRDEVLPESVLGTIEARLDAEGGEGKLVLRAASVFGDRFTAKGVDALLAGALHPSRTAAWIEVLVAKELFVKVNGSAQGEDSFYAFQHSLVREAAYAMLTEHDRTLGHRLAGEWIERTGSSDPMVLAEHFRRGEEPARAVRWYHRAAFQALEASDLSAAVEGALRGVECGAAGEQLGALRLVEAEARVWRGELALAERCAVEAVALLDRGSAEWFRGLAQAAVAAGKLGRYDVVEGFAGTASEVAASSAARSAQIICLCECATFLMFGGRYAAADALIERLRRDAPDPGARSSREAALIHQIFAIRASCAGDPGACLAAFESSLASFEQAGDKRNACAVRANIGFVLEELGDFERAERALRTALLEAGKMGLCDLEAAALQNLGRALAYLGRLEEARSIEQRATDMFKELGDPRMEGVSLMYLAEIALFAGDLELAEQEARSAAAKLDVAPPTQATAIAVLGRVLLRRGRVEEALHAARQAFAILESLGALEEGESLVRLVHAEALEAAGEPAELARAIASARDRLLSRAAKITDPAWREQFLKAAPDNARTLAMWAQATGHREPSDTNERAA
jgi:tetratricopeptide (TPR) repeat protein